MFIIFEGLDKTGKGTLELEFLKETGWKDIVVDRGPAGYMAFDKIKGRETTDGNNEYERLIKMITFSPDDYVIIYLKAPWPEVQKRLKKHNEECEYDYVKAQKIYDEHVNKYKNKTQLLKLETTKSIEECKKIICDFIAQYKYNRNLYK